MRLSWTWLATGWLQLFVTAAIHAGWQQYIMFSRTSEGFPRLLALVIGIAVVPRCGRAEGSSFQAAWLYFVGL